MYRLPRDYELRVHWKQSAKGEWNTERIVCHGKVVEHSLNDAPAGSKKSLVDVGGCGEFLKFPDLGDAVSYSAIHLRALPPASAPALFEEDVSASRDLRVKLWKQMEAYADVMPAVKHGPAGAALIERFRAENGYPPPGLLTGQKERLEKVGEDSVATYYRCFVPVAAQMEAYGIYIVPKSAKLPAPLVIAQHGNNGSPEVAMFHGAGNYKDMIRGAVARGYIVYAPHLVTFNARDQQEGSPIPEDVRAQLDKKFRDKGASLTGIEALRITKALDALVERKEVDRTRIAMIGLSLGGSTTLVVAALDARIKVAVASCGFRYKALDASPLTSSQMISAIVPRPLQIQAGRRDPLVSIDSARPAGSIGPELYNKVKAKDRFDFEEFDGGHEFNGDLAFPFLEKYLLRSTI
jgi:dienelactone hydrolase